MTVGTAALAADFSDTIPFSRTGRTVDLNESAQKCAHSIAEPKRKV
jgi:hypothetical protein